MNALPLSLEARAQMIADESTRVEYAGKTDVRRDAVKAVALKHLREAMGLANNVE